MTSPFQVDSGGTLAPRYMGLYFIEQINRSAVRLKLPATFRVQPVFHTLLVQQWRAPFFPQSIPPPSHIIDGQLASTAKEILDVLRRGRSYHTSKSTLEYLGRNGLLAFPWKAFVRRGQKRRLGCYKKCLHPLILPKGGAGTY